MRFLLLLSALFLAVSLPAQDFFEKSDFFFAENVSNNKVDYKKLVANSAGLDELIDQIKKQDLTALAESDKKAFLINSYNLLVINQVIENWPTKSVMEIGGFFESNKVVIGGKKMTLNDLENKEIRTVYNDPRVHFVLVCGANGCPPIINKAYLPATLNAQLDLQTKIAMNNPNFIQVNEDGDVKISEIFNWYKEDFLAKGNIIEYINSYRDIPISVEQKPRYYPYDWSINVRSIISGASSKAVQSFDPEDPKSESAAVNLQTYTAGSLLKKNQADFTIFNSIYTESENNWQGQDYSGYRTTFASSLIQFTYGVTKSARINLGLDISLKGSGKANNDESYNQIGRAFDFRNDDSTRVGVSYIAPKIKIQPFKNVADFTLQSSFNIVLPKHPEGYSNPDGSGTGNLLWIEWDRHVWWTQFFYTKMMFDDKFQVFAELDLLFRFKSSTSQITHFDLPASVFLSYFPTKKITTYGMIQHVPRFLYDTKEPQINDWLIRSNYTQYGAGLKYQLKPSINIELLYTNFFRAQNGGLGETFNLGIKYVLF
ncbi:MAG: DUF547 domain-containing protein [Salibacteraceae bacterium]|nr:DUF547 domain-containing protein [Salibacteraceae bacterium]